VISESFIEAVKDIERARNFHPQMVKELISICNKVSFNHSQEHLRDMFLMCIAIIQSIPDTEYKLHIDIVETFTTALVELGKNITKLQSFLMVSHLIPKKRILGSLFSSQIHIYTQWHSL
jgi:hypothetical protein